MAGRGGPTARDRVETESVTREVAKSLLASPASGLVRDLTTVLKWPPENLGL